MKSKMFLTIVCCAMLGLVNCGPVTAQAENKLEFALRGLDPVELVQGRETEGSNEFVASSGKFRYRFRSEANRKLFETDPEKYGIRFDGACMRMGPLSGAGDADRFAVHGEGIYVFASDACRNTFLKSPDKFIVRDEPKLRADESSTSKAKAVLDRAVEALGGKEKLESIETLGIDFEISLKMPDSETRFIRRTILESDFDYFTEDVYEKYRGGWKVSGGRGYFTWGKGEFAGPAVSRFMIRTAMHDPVAVLKAYAKGKTESGIAEPRETDDPESDSVVVRTGESSTTLIVNRRTGLITGTRFEGWGNLGMSVFERTYSDFRPVEGIPMPHSMTTKVDGKVTEGLTTRVISIRINDAKDAGQTSLPAPLAK